jgi:hypothetical protein
VIFDVRDDIYEQHGCREKQDRLEAAGRWGFVERRERFRPFTMKEPPVITRLFVYRVLWSAVARHTSCRTPRTEATLVNLLIGFR